MENPANKTARPGQRSFLLCAAFFVLLLVCSSASALNVQLGFPHENQTLNNGVTVVFNYTVDAPAECTALVWANNSGAPIRSNKVNVPGGVWNQTFGGFNNGNYLWNVNCSDGGPMVWGSSDHNQTFSINMGGGGGPPGGGGDTHSAGFSYQSSIDSPYVFRNQSKLLIFSMRRNAGNQSCLSNLSIRLPANYTFNGFNSSGENSSSYNFSVINGDTLFWNASNQSNSSFFCGQGPGTFTINVTSNASFGASKFEVTGLPLTEAGFASVNMTVFTTTTFSYNGTVYDLNGNPLEGATASLYVVSHSMSGETVLGTFSNNTGANGVFNITGVPGLNVSLAGGGGPGGPGADSLNYQLSVVKYNDTPTDHLGMYVGPTLPDIGEQELRSSWGLSNPEIKLRPAVAFHVQVEGYDYASQPTNNNGTCPGPQCPGWQPVFPFTNIGYNYELKDSGLGYPVSSDHSTNALERYFSAPLARNYSLMVFPEASFPMYVSFQNIGNNCNATGKNISTTGVAANCTIANGTYKIDVVINANMTIANYTGSANLANMSAFHLVVYRLGPGQMIFDQDTLPFNMKQMQVWPKNDTSKDDYYNLTSGEFQIGLPVTAAQSDMMLMAYAVKDDVYYQDIFNLSSLGMAFVPAGTDHNFTMQTLINGTNKSLTSRNISANWNDTTVVQTTAVQFNMVSNGTVISTENSFIEMQRKTGNISYKRMTNAESGTFSMPVAVDEGIKKLTIYSQNYAPISTPISAAILSGADNSSTVIRCYVGVCNITMKTFDTVDPKSKASLDISIIPGKSTPECDVPNWNQSCDLAGGGGDGVKKDGFSPLKAQLMGDISLRIQYRNLSVHYINTDLMASGPPDASFSENATGSGMTSAWQFGSMGPDIYTEVLIGMPYAPALGNANITVGIPVLYDNEFNVIWNASKDNITTINTNDSLEAYRDYLNSSYEAYLNGTGVACLTNNENLTNGLCFKDTVKKRIWMKLLHFSGVGPEVTATGASNGSVSFNVSKTALNSTYTVGDTMSYVINVTNTGNNSLVLINVNDTFNSSQMSLNWSSAQVNDSGIGYVYWYNVSASPVGPNASVTFTVNMTALAVGADVRNNITVTATDANGNTSTANTTVSVAINASSPLSMRFVSPTPANGTTSSNASVQINVLISAQNALSNLTYDWNGTNTTLYNDSLVLMLNFDNVSALGENSTYVVDASRYGYNGTVSGAVWNATGKYGGAYMFNGSNYITLNNQVDLSGSNYGTWSAWVKPASATGGVIYDNRQVYLFWSPYVANRFGCDVYRGGSWVNGDAGPYTSADYPPGNWYHLVVTWDGVTGKHRIYVNGMLALETSTTTGAISKAQTTSLTIGAYYTNASYFFNGSIDEVRIWNRTLAAQEVYEQYVSNLQKYNATQWYLYVSQSKNSTTDLDDGTYTYQVFATDASGNSNSTEQRTVIVTPSVSLNSPAAAYVQSTASTRFNLTFNCSANNTIGLANISLYLTNGTNVSFARNQTTSVSGTNASASWSLNLTRGNYTWNCLAYDSAGNGGWASANRSIVLNNSGNITANDDAFTANTSIPTSINVTSNDVGAGGLRVGQVTSPSHGTAVLNSDGTINYTSEAGFVGTDSFTYTVTSNSLYHNGTGHYYEYVASTINWANANTSAKARTLYGLSGYLVTINSSAENDFIKQKISSDSWIGASDAESEGVWKWVTGPEAGVQFWQGTGDSGSSVGGNYNNWNTHEPNDQGNEDYGEFYTGTGKWNDLSASATVGGYIAEYGGMPGDVPDFPTAVVTVHVSDSIAPVVSLNTPSANYALNTSNVMTNVSFNCSATDAGGLANISLYITNAVNASFAWNQTANVSGSSNSSAWTMALPGGNYTWNCRAYDFAGNDAYAGSNRSITINYDGTAPQVSIGRNASSVEYPVGSINVNWSASDNFGLSSVLFNITYPNSSLLFYSTASSGALVLNSSNLTAVGNYSIVIWANDSVGNVNSSADYFTVVTTTTTTTQAPSGPPQTTTTISTTMSTSASTTTTTTGNGTSTTLFRIPGDADGDRHVDYHDLIILAATYWKHEGDPGYDARADYNEDGVVDYDDLVILAVNYGRWG